MGVSNRIPRCPHCVSRDQFRPMQILENGRQICQGCGHIVFPGDQGFWCPCPECVKTHLSKRFRAAHRRGRLRFIACRSARSASFRRAGSGNPDSRARHKSRMPVPPDGEELSVRDALGLPHFPL